ncbi:hypothetical protein CO046_04020 [Candidatus Peregrinibacteria bacterium CG_4_9_14_0_2_um_filter_53_11]|nr:MAG: hypothetical protein CO046_04020 [Candidatus Peregrinibacteria bacterium CG_4_9_14_0_2_um_filter_53_11]
MRIARNLDVGSAPTRDVNSGPGTGLRTPVAQHPHLDGEALSILRGGSEVVSLDEHRSAISEQALNSRAASLLTACGISAFNELRCENPDWTPTFERRTFNRLDLCNANLRGAKFHYVTFEGVNLFAARLDGAHFEGCAINNLSAASADLRGAHFANTNFFNCTFSLSDLSGARFEGVRLSGTMNFAEADLRGVQGLEPAQLTHAVLHQVKLDPPMAEAVMRSLWATWQDALRTA